MDRCSKERFLASCGLSGPLRLKLDDFRGTQTRAFEVPFVVAGRDPRTDLIVNHPAVSRRHLYLQVIAGRIFAVEIGGRRGDNGETAIAGHGWVDDQRGMSVGPIRIRPDVATEPVELGDALNARSLDDSPLPNVVLEFPHQANRPSWKLSRVLTLLGRTPECRLRFLDPEISKFHCSLLRTPSGVWVIDLLSRTGIRLNGMLVRWALLENGDQLQIGPHLIQVRSTMPTSNQTDPEIRSLTTVALVKPQPVLPAPRLEDSYAPPRDPAAFISTELAQSMMTTMANQFSQMQQQMFEQFQQTLIMMAQTFGALQRDQMAQVRDELDQLRRLNQDLLALQVQANRENPSATLPALPAVRSTHGEVATDDVLTRIETLLQESAATAEPPPAPESASSTVITDSGIKEPPLVPPSPVPDSPPLDTGVEELKDSPPRSQASTASSHLTTPQETPLADDQIHSLLCRRMAKLQQERQGRWQKICDLMLGR